MQIIANFELNEKNQETLADIWQMIQERKITGLTLDFMILDKVREAKIPDEFPLYIKINKYPKYPLDIVVEKIRSWKERKNLLFFSSRQEDLEYLSSHLPGIRTVFCLADNSLAAFLSLVPATKIFSQIKTEAIIAPIKSMNKKLIERAKKEGWKVFGSVSRKDEELDREGLWSYLETLELDGIFTNFPRQLVSWLEEVELDKKVILSTERILADRKNKFCD